MHREPSVETIVHNTRTLGIGLVLERFPEIVTSGRRQSHQRFCTPWIAWTSASFLPLPSQIGATRVGGSDLNRPRMRSAMVGVVALSAAPEDFVVADWFPRVQAMTGQAGDRLHRPSGHLRPTQAQGQAIGDQASTIPALRTTSRCRPHDDGSHSPAGSGHRPHPCRVPRAQARSQAEHLDGGRR